MVPTEAEVHVETTYRDSLFRMAAYRRANPLDQGLHLYRARAYDQAAGVLAAACSGDCANDAVSFYMLALAQRQAGDASAAEAALKTAVQVEAEYPAANWGARMERVQGYNRIWIETARREAGLGR